MAKAPGLEWDDLEPGKLEALLEQIQPLIQPEDFCLLQRVIATLHLVLDLIQKARLSMRRLRQMVFGPKTQKSRQVLAKAREQTGTQGDKPAGASEKATVATEWTIIRERSGSPFPIKISSPGVLARSAKKAGSTT